MGEGNSFGFSPDAQKILQTQALSTLSSGIGGAPQPVDLGGGFRAFLPQYPDVGAAYGQAQQFDLSEKLRQKELQERRDLMVFGEQLQIKSEKRQETAQIASEERAFERQKDVVDYTAERNKELRTEEREYQTERSKAVRTQSMEDALVNLGISTKTPEGKLKSVEQMQLEIAQAQAENLKRQDIREDVMDVDKRRLMDIELETAGVNLGIAKDNLSKIGSKHQFVHFGDNFALIDPKTGQVITRGTISPDGLAGAVSLMDMAKNLKSLSSPEHFRTVRTWAHGEGLIDNENVDFKDMDPFAFLQYQQRNVEGKPPPENIKDAGGGLWEVFKSSLSVGAGPPGMLPMLKALGGLIEKKVQKFEADPQAKVSIDTGRFQQIFKDPEKLLAIAASQGITFTDTELQAAKEMVGNVHSLDAKAMAAVMVRSGLAVGVASAVMLMQRIGLMRLGTQLPPRPGVGITGQFPRPGVGITGQTLIPP
jgi:hypothetical protein